jgi:hypothetical protein
MGAAVAVIAFDARVLNERGTSVSLYDYADHAERRLGHRSLVFHEARADAGNDAVVRRFAERFETIGYRDFADLAAKAVSEKADLLYAQKIGPPDGRLAGGVKNAAHVLFQHYEPHGEVYAYISEWLSAYMTRGRSPWVPYIVTLPEPERRLRRDWGFSEDAVVLGRHGGYDQFDLPFVAGAVEEALARRGDLCFAFLNTAPFIDHARVRFLPAVHDPRAKADFIASCDGMLHGRKAGESFGHAVAEFLCLDKPVICWEGGKDRNHLLMVWEPSRFYRTARDLLEILLAFQPAPSEGRQRERVAAFTPESVMAKFQAVFLEPAVAAPAPSPIRLAGSHLATRAMVLRGRLWRDQGVREVKAWRAVRGALKA